MNKMVQEKYSSLNVIGPHKLIKSGIISKCGLIEVCVVLLKDMCYCVGRLLCCFAQCDNPFPVVF